MKYVSRRSVICASAGLAATSALSRPYIANAQAKTITFWVGSGLRQGGRRGLQEHGRRLREGERQQDRAQHHPVRRQHQKIVSALTSGDMPDLLFHDAPTTILPQTPGTTS